MTPAAFRGRTSCSRSSRRSARRARRRPAARGPRRDPRGIVADLRRYLAVEARTGFQWRPRALEARFGFDEDPASEPALELEADGERVRVRGMIDGWTSTPPARGPWSATTRAGPPVHSARAGAGSPIMSCRSALHARGPAAARARSGAGIYSRSPAGSCGRAERFWRSVKLGADAYGTDAYDRAGDGELLDEVERDAVRIAVGAAHGRADAVPGDLLT